MSKTYVTFGQVHTHSVNGKTFNKDCVAVIKAENASEGRDKAFEYFGPEFCFEYFDDEFEESSMRFYPRGFINVD